MNKISVKSLIIYIALYLTLFVDLYYNLDYSNNGSTKDFYQTFPLILDLNNLDISNWGNHTRHFPLHYVIMAFIYYIFENEFYIRIIYLFLVFFVPYIFFLNLKIKYPEISKDKLFIFSSILFLFPFFRSSAVWPNSMMTSFFFYILSSYYFLNFLNTKKKYLMFLSITFLSFAVYSVQYFAAFFLIYLFIIFQELGKKTLINFFLICLLFSIPGFIFLNYLPYTSNITFSENFSNVLIISLSVIFFYLMSLTNFDNIKILLDNLSKRLKNRKIIFLSIFILISYLVFFNYPELTNLGGGIFVKISNIIYGNNLIIIIFSLLGFFYLIAVSDNDNNSLYIGIIFLTFFLISYNEIIYQKYYEPMYLFSFIIFAKNNFIIKVLEKYKNIFLAMIFYFIYLNSSFLYSYFLN